MTGGDTDDPMPSDPPENAPLADAAAPVAAAGDDVPEEAVLRRAEDKPPLYRFFRGGSYAVYMAVAVWFVLCIVFAAWNAVWGAPGEALRAGQSTAQPLTATPDPIQAP